ncbi:MAG TPA: GMC family oxidoreductase N-terminal domain-containing protein, partial [Myxococcota bacterium]|nr:GMC family oxidoreductase N-terminal domain-containing protein [Myxococcota bacterium]
MTAFTPERVVGNAGLSRFDVCVIGSGSGGSAAAEMLARGGARVLVLEAGPNWFTGLADPDPSALGNAFSNDELKFRRRFLLETDPLVEPRSWRASEADGVRTHVGDVNLLPKMVGGAAHHAELTCLRFRPSDFELGSRLLGRWPGTSFADWPVAYDELEPFYGHAEWTLGVSGDDQTNNPFAPPRSRPLPMPPGAPKAADTRVRAACDSLGLHGYPTPRAITTRAFDGRPACLDCGFCGEYGCPTHAKGGPAVTTLRKALLTGNVLLLAETRAVRLHLSPSGREVREVEAIDPSGARVRLRADRFVLAASPIEDARLLCLSGEGGRPIANSSGLVGRNLMFHIRHYVTGVCDARLRTSHGKPPMSGFDDFRGDPDDPKRPLGGVVVAGGTGQLVREALTYAKTLRLRGSWLASWLRQSPLRDRLLSIGMYAEDAPQATNRVDLDPDLRDLDGLPVARVTYRHHEFELSARRHYLPRMAEIMKAAGGRYGLMAPIDTP